MPVQDAQSGVKLHDETLSELGLTEQPFLEDKQRQPVADSTSLKTRAALEQHVRFGDSLHLLIGQEGSGKTVLLQQLLKHCKNNIKPFVVKGSDDFRAEAFLYAVLNDLNNAEEKAESLEDYIDSLAPIFDQITEDQLNPLLIIDDAHLVPIKEIAVLVDTLQNFENEDGKTARLLLTGTSELQQSIKRFEEQFEDLELNYSTTSMQPLDEARTREYLSARLHQAGFADTFPFTDKAISKIQQESDGLPGRINQSASHYLNGVYQGSAGGTAQAGWLSSLEWPVLAVGAAALAAIGLGLALFFGNDPETEVIQIAATDTTTQIEQQSLQPVQPVEVEQPVVSPTSVNNATEDLSQDTLVITEPDSTPIVSEQADTATLQTDSDTVASTAAIAEPTAETNRLVLPDTPTTQSDLAETITAVTNDTTSPIAVTVPVNDLNLIADQDTAANKSVSNKSVSNISTSQASTSQLSESELSQNTDPAELGAATAPLVNNDTVSIEETVTGLLDGDTDAAATAADNSFQSEPEFVAADPDRAIENERWVLFQSPLKFTVQLATSRERDYIIELAQTMEVQEPVAIYPFLTTNSNNPVFGLLSGIYDTRTEAITAVENMTEEAKKFGVWIRPVSDLQADIKRRN